MDNSKADNDNKLIASQLLAGMLANPHIYSNRSDEGVRGQLEQTLILLAVEMAEELSEKVDRKSD